MTNTIVIARTDAGYSARFNGGDMDGVIASTPHTPRCPIDTVIADVQKLNTEYKVIRSIRDLNHTAL